MEHRALLVASEVKADIDAVVAEHRRSHSQCGLTAMLSHLGDSESGPLACWITGDGGVEVTVWAYEDFLEVVVVDERNGRQRGSRRGPLTSPADFVAAVSFEVGQLS